MSSLWGPGNLFGSWHLGLSSGYPWTPLSHCYTLFKFLTLCTTPLSPPISEPALPLASALSPVSLPDLLPSLFSVIIFFTTLNCIIASSHLSRLCIFWLLKRIFLFFFNSLVHTWPQEVNQIIFYGHKWVFLKWFLLLVCTVCKIQPGMTTALYVDFILSFLQ